MCSTTFKKLKNFSRYKLTKIAQMSHRLSCPDVSRLFVKERVVQYYQHTASRSLWLGSTEDHAVATERPARIHDVRQTALHLLACMCISSTERIKLISYKYRYRHSIQHNLYQLWLANSSKCQPFFLEK